MILPVEVFGRSATNPMISARVADLRPLTSVSRRRTCLFFTRRTGCAEQLVRIKLGVQNICCTADRRRQVRVLCQPHARRRQASACRVIGEYARARLEQRISPDRCGRNSVAARCFLGSLSCSEPVPLLISGPEALVTAQTSNERLSSSRRSAGMRLSSPVCTNGWCQSQRRLPVQRRSRRMCRAMSSPEAAQLSDTPILARVNR